MLIGDVGEEEAAMEGTSLLSGTRVRLTCGGANIDSSDKSVRVEIAP